MTEHTCPVCEYPHLPEPPADYEICPSCGTEFGYEDLNTSHADLRARWEAAGRPWWSKRREKPEGWLP